LKNAIGEQKGTIRHFTFEESKLEEQSAKDLLKNALVSDAFDDDSSDDWLVPKIRMVTPRNITLNDSFEDRDPDATINLKGKDLLRNALSAEFDRLDDLEEVIDDYSDSDLPSQSAFTVHTASDTGMADQIEKERLLMQIGEQSETIADLESERDESFVKVSRLESQLEFETSAELARQEEEINRLQEELKRVKSDRGANSDSGEVSRLVDEIKESESTKSFLKAQLEKNQRIMQEQREEIASQKKRFEEMRKRYGNQELLSRELAATRETAKRQIANLQNKIQTQETLLRTMKERIHSQRPIDIFGTGKRGRQSMQVNLKAKRVMKEIRFVIR